MMPNNIDSVPVERPESFDIRVANIKVLREVFPAKYHAFIAEIQLMIIGDLKEQRAKYYEDYTDYDLQALIDEA